jgi:hypothetical protein
MDINDECKYWAARALRAEAEVIRIKAERGAAGYCDHRRQTTDQYGVTCDICGLSKKGVCWL